jgi:imidazoleglycerol phosphate synthase glutamine amidotransferase subunit HisH
MGLYLLDYGAGNVQSLANSLKKLGHDFEWISSPADFDKATVRASKSIVETKGSHLQIISSRV